MPAGSAAAGRCRRCPAVGWPRRSRGTRCGARSDPAPAPPSARRAAPPGANRLPRRRRVVRAVMALLVVVGLVALYPLGLYFYVDRSMGRVDALATDGPEVLAPQLQAGHQNYLVVGSHVPGEKGAASVALLLASVSADGAARRAAHPSAHGARRHPGVPDRRRPAAGAADRGVGRCPARRLRLLRRPGRPGGLRPAHRPLPGPRPRPAARDGRRARRRAGLRRPVGRRRGGRRPLPAGGSRVSGSDAAAYLRPADPGADVTGAEVA